MKSCDFHFKLIILAAVWRMDGGEQRAKKGR